MDDTSAGKERRKKHKGLKRVISVTLCFVALIGLFFLLFYVRSDTGYFKYELGESVSTDLNDYISGMDWAVKLSTLDLSLVDENHVGLYEASLKHGPFQHFTYRIEIEDTTPPDLKVVEGIVPIQRLIDYSCEDFVLSCEDKSEDVTLSFDKQGSLLTLSASKETVTGKLCGEDVVSVVAVDPSGNESRAKVKVLVDDPPSIEGAQDVYIVLGYPVDLSENVTAVDETDGYIPVVEASVLGDYQNTLGDYEIKYSAKDSFGFESEEKATLHVLEPMALQELVNRHEIEGNSPYAYGVINPYDMGVSVNSSIDEVESLILPTLVHVRVDRENGYSHGSGFIINITDDEVIICTNEHVVHRYETMDVYFFDGKMAKGRVLSKISVPDIAFMSVSLSDLSETTRSQIKTVHLNTPYFNSLGDNPDVDIYVRANYQSGDIWKQGEGKIVRKSGVLSQYFAGFDYPVTQVDVTLIAGMSGSPIFDETGSLVCMAAFIWYNGSFYERYGVKVTDIVAYYKEVFGKDADYYIAYQ